MGRLDVWWHSTYDLPQGGVGPSAWPSRFRFDKLPNVLMSAHTSGQTMEAVGESIREVAANLDALARGEPLRNVVRKGVPVADAAEAIYGPRDAAGG